MHGKKQIHLNIKYAVQNPAQQMIYTHIFERKTWLFLTFLTPSKYIKYKRIKSAFQRGK